MCLRLHLFYAYSSRLTMFQYPWVSQKQFYMSIIYVSDVIPIDKVALVLRDLWWLKPLVEKKKRFSRNLGADIEVLIELWLSQFKLRYLSSTYKHSPHDPMLPNGPMYPINFRYSTHKRLCNFRSDMWKPTFHGQETVVPEIKPTVFAR